MSSTVSEAVPRIEASKIFQIKLKVPARMFEFHQFKEKAMKILTLPVPICSVSDRDPH